MTTPESFSSTPLGQSEPKPNGERLHRTDAQREAPIRNVYTSRNGGASSSTSSSEQTSAETDKLAYGVDLGYNVINEQIAKAKDLAAQWAGPSGKHTSPGTTTTDWRHIASRMLHAYQDLGAVYLDAMQKLVDNLAGDEIEKTAPHSTQPPPVVAQTPLNIAIKLRTSTVAEADLILNPGCGGQLAVAALHGPAGTAPITSCTFTPGEEHHLVLAIDVPSSVSGGAYSGVVVDTHTNEPCGTLCLRVGASVDRR